MSRNLNARLRKLEASAGDEKRPVMFVSAPRTHAEWHLLRTEWRTAVAQGIAKYWGGALYVTDPPLTTEQWLAQAPHNGAPQGDGRVHPSAAGWP